MGKDKNPPKQQSSLMLPASIFCLAVALGVNAYLLHSGSPSAVREYHGFFSKLGFETKNFREVSKTDVQQYWDTKPCNSGWRFGDEKVGTKEYFEEVEARKYKVEYHIPPFAEFPKWKGKKVLEVGGGICTTATSFAKHGANISVIDLSPKSMELCKQRFGVYGLNANFYVGDAEHLSNFVPVEPYDLVWSFGVIHHSPYPELSAKEIRKYMNKDSVFKLMLYTKVSFKLFWIMKHTNHWDLSKMDEVVAHYSEAVEGSPVTYTYTISEARMLLEDAGFEVLSVEKAHIFPYEISAYHQNKYVKEKMWDGVSDHRFQDLEKELGWHMLLTARIKQ